MKVLGKFLFIITLVVSLGYLIYEKAPALLKLDEVSIIEWQKGQRDWLFDDIKKSLTKQTKAMHGKYVWEVDLNQILSSIEKDKRVEKVQIQRKLPNKIEVKLLPHEPFAIYWGGSHSILPVSKDGTLLPALAKDAYYEAPILRGRVFLESHDLRKRAIEILELSQSKKFIHNRKASELLFDKKQGFILIMSPDGEELFLGEEDFDRRLFMAEKVLNYLSGQGIKGRILDLRFSKKVVVKVRDQKSL